LIEELKGKEKERKKKKKEIRMSFPCWNNWVGFKELMR